jgi:hypothetical protein
VVLANGDVLVEGGIHSSIIIKSQGTVAAAGLTELWDHDANLWRQAFGVARVGGAIVKSQSGGVFAVAGFEAGEPTGRLNEFDQIAQAWLPRQQVPEALTAALVVPLPGDRLLLTGGVSRTAAFTSTFIYDAKANNWETADELPLMGLALGQAALAGHCDVLVVGGWDLQGRHPIASAALWTR